MPKKFSLTDHFLHHSYVRGSVPLRSIMELPREEAAMIDDAFATKVFGDAKDPIANRMSYYDYRRDVEDWLRGAAEKNGVQIKARHPVYFRLLAAPKEDADANRSSLHIPITPRAISRCTFTVGDSFCNHRHVLTDGKDAYGMTPHPYLGQVLPLGKSREALEALKILGNEPGDYIEVQMWDRPAFRP